MKNQFINTLLFLLFLQGFTSFSQETEKEKIQWMTFEEAIQANEKEKKFIFIDVYTDWCGWCKKMDNTTFQDENVIAMMNKNFYAVKLDAEQKEDIIYKGNKFKFINQGRRGYHELAAQLLQGQMSYPSFVILSPQESINAIIKGFQDAETFQGSLNQSIQKQ